ncbi:MAG: glycosyltransferase family 39 protein [Anaerolineae bacterium]|nr:glycosyltransferase family 39 protein [Anaerolineae bacterium]
MNTRVQRFFTLILLLLVAFGLRMYAIDRQDIWGDEAYSIWFSRQPWAQVIASDTDPHPPGHPVVLALWLRATGITPLAVRTLSALQNFLIIPIVYILGKRSFGNQTAFLAATFAAISPGLLYHAQETRMYSQVALFMGLACYFFLRLLEPRPPRAGWWGYVITALAAGYTHYYAFFVIVAQNLIMGLHLYRNLHVARQKHWKTFWRWCGTQLILIAAYVPWVLVQQDFLSGKASYRITEWTLATLTKITQETFTGIGAGLALTPTTAQAVMLPMAVTGAIGMLSLLQAKMPARAIAAFLWIPVGIAWIVNPLMPFFFPRYLLVVAPAFYLLLAAGVTLLTRLWRPLGLISIAALLLGSSIGTHAYYVDKLHIRGRYGQMMNYIAEHAQEGDALLWTNSLQVRILEYYQPRGLASYFITASNPPTAPQTGETLETIVAKHPRLWLVRFGNQAEYDPIDIINTWLATHTSKAHFSTWDGSDLALYISHSNTTTLVNPIQFTLGETISLSDYSVSANSLAPGDTLILTLYWSTHSPITSRYTVFTHLLDSTGTLWAQMDSEPLGGSLPTDRWPIDSRIQDNYALMVPASTPPGTYTLQVGMYVLETGIRLPVQETGQDHIILQTIEVQSNTY